MKKISRLLILIGFAVLNYLPNANAQIAEGTKAIGGTFSFRFNESNDVISVVPDFSYYIKENLGLGVRVGFTHQIDQTDPFIGFYIRKHVFINDKFNFYGEGFVQYASTYYSGVGNGNDVSLGVRPGLSYFVSERFALEATFGVISFSQDIDNESSEFQFTFSPSSVGGFGIKYFFP